MDLPRFMKDDVVGWLSKFDIYFDLDKMLKEHKVMMASLVSDKAGYQWYDGLTKSSPTPVS